MINAARKSATSNPFIIYNFYNQLDKIVTENNLTPKQIWNCDESKFPTDPQKCKVVSIKGEVAYKVKPGASRENITTLPVCNAVGRANELERILNLWVNEFGAKQSMRKDIFVNKILEICMIQWSKRIKYQKWL